MKVPGEFRREFIVSESKKPVSDLPYPVRHPVTCVPVEFTVNLPFPSNLPYGYRSRRYPVPVSYG